jgi:hypothetical protein
VDRTRGWPRAPVKVSGGAAARQVAWYVRPPTGQDLPRRRRQGAVRLEAEGRAPALRATLRAKVKAVSA